MTLRILGGAFRGRLLKSPKGEQTRPTLAVMRKAVFDILQSDVEGAAFLDLFAGSGAMGFEALSRGASHVTFVESNRFALRAIEENIQILKAQTQCSVMGYDTLLALKKLAKGKQRFDLAYADPPYAVAPQLIEEILALFDSHSLLNANGRLFLEEAAPPTLKAPSLAHLHLVDTRTFSRSALHQFRSTS
jgi:16S rRNA (guanine966-N2)-methyltransferase